VHRAVELGVTLLDMAPMYGEGEAENVVGEAFNGQLPLGVRVTTKCMLGMTAIADIESTLRASLRGSLGRMRLGCVDILILHSFIAPDDFDATPLGALGRTVCTHWTYVNGFIPAAQKLKTEGLIGDWGISGIGFPDQVLRALSHSAKPAVVQVISNPLDSAGELTIWPSGPSKAREIGAAAAASGVGIMAIRAVNAGALTDSIDRKLSPRSRVRSDFDRAGPVRLLANTLRMSTATLAHRYALGMHGGGHTVVLGVKNCAELEECVAAACDGPLGADISRQIDEAVAHSVCEASGVGMDSKVAVRVARLTASKSKL
jgi:aryl-alcohol dehydrogenase-like predicted oxidoreductase